MRWVLQIALAFVYRIVYAIGFCLVGPVWLLTRVAHYGKTVPGRLTFRLPPRPQGPGGEAPFWIHAVSVGEVAVAATLVEAMPEGMPLVVTTVTPTGQEQAEKAFGERAATAIAYLPFDFDLTVWNFLRRFEPRALLLVEGEHWPVLLAHARRRGLPIAVANGRLGDRSWSRWGWLRWLPHRFAARFMFGTVDRFGLQTEQDLRRFAALGVDEERLVVTGNVKFDAEAGAGRPQLEARLAALAAGRPILIAGSTMEGEEPLVLAAFRAAGGGERAMLILAPRHRERWDEVARRLDDEGWTWLRRSRLEAADGEAAAGRPAVVLLDSYGDLASLYRLAAAAFVGGTLADTGGHNPVESARFGVPTAVGPSMYNFRDMAAQFDAAGAWRRVESGDDLGRAWAELLDDSKRARELGARGLELVERNRGATRRTLDMLAPLLADAS